MNYGEYKYYLELVEQVFKSSELYYKGKEPLFSDAEFDEKARELVRLEKRLGFISEKSPSNKILYKLDPKNTKEVMPHGGHRMLSIANIFNVSEIDKFLDKLKAFNKKDMLILVEPKFDGLAGSICIDAYTNEIKYVLTRGDGDYGRIITDNFKTLIKGFDCNAYKPVDGVDEYFVRGEILLENQEFKRIKLNSKTDLSNPRNLVSGLLNTKNMSNFVEGAYVIFEPYDWINVSKDTIVPSTLPEHYDLSDPKSYEIIHEKIAALENTKNSFSFNIDGAVLKVMDPEIRKQMGENNKYPNWMKAYKFKDKEYETTIHDILYFTGRSGVITPVAQFEEINIGGVSVRYATLHNKSNMEKLHLAKGDSIFVIRSADVIPKIINSLPREVKDGDKPREEFEFTKECPICGNELVEGGSTGVQMYCINEKCPEQVIKKISHMVSKECLDIKGFGESTVRQLFDHNIIKDLIDVFYMATDNEFRDKVSKLNGWDIVSVNNLFTSIKETLLIRGIFDYQLLGSISIPLIGKATAKFLYKKLTRSELDSMISEIHNGESKQVFYDLYGEKKAVLNSLLDYEEDILDILTSVEANGIKIIESKLKEGEVEIPKSGICISGTFDRPRSDIEIDIENLGYEVHNSIKSNTKYLLSPVDNNTTKMKAAKDKGIAVIQSLDEVVEVKNGDNN